MKLPLILIFAFSHVVADELETITIEDSLIINPNISTPAQYNRTSGTSADGGDFLNQINGISTSRFGGRGLEPVIRGQSQTRLNILLDGAYIHGGCPNRMDPPASWAALETYEEVKVLKGVQSVVYGGGGSGGTVLFERDSRGLAEEEGTHGRVSVSASNNGTKGDILADGTFAVEGKGYARLITEIKTMDDYEDGDGNTVRSSFEHKQGGIILGFTPTEERLFELSLERNEFTDALYPGAGMDSPEESGDIIRLRFEDKPNLPWLSAVKVEAYLSDVDHVMNNYSLRNPPKYMLGTSKGQVMLRETTTESTTTGGRIQLSSIVGTIQWNYGIDIQNNQRDATLANMDNGAAKAISLMWPDANINQTGLFAEAEQNLSNKNRLKYGLRLDFIMASADKANIKPIAGPKTASQVYEMYYGNQATDQDETNVGGLLRYEKDLQQGLKIGVGVSRSVRTADATERYINKWGMPANNRWVGNPMLKPEQHHQVDFSIGQNQSGFNWNTVLFYDKVTDYILRDAARSQDGILLADNADIYRNVDASLYGIEWEGSLSINKNLDISANLAYVHSDNDTDDRAIAQTPPLNGTLQLDYQQMRWGVGTRLRFADQQHRIDLLSKQEVGETAGYATLDLYGNYLINQMFSLKIGVDNLLDKTYAQHINRANLMDTQAFRVNEPGRNIWLRVNAEF